MRLLSGLASTWENALSLARFGNLLDGRKQPPRPTYFTLSTWQNSLQNLSPRNNSTSTIARLSASTRSNRPNRPTKMAGPVFAVRPSADLPAVNDMMQTICQALHDATMADFVLLRPYLAAELNMCKMPKGNTPAKTMQGIARDEELAYTKLMLAIPKEVAISVARYTVASDFVPRRSGPALPKPPYTYSGKFKGVYAVSAALEGRDGRFLSPREIRVLIKCMEGYLAAAARHVRSGDQWPDASPRTSRNRNVIRPVDTAYNNPRPDDKPRLVKGAAGIDNVTALVDIFKVYLKVPAIPATSPSGNLR
jgi:hypothetical protein